MTKHLDYLYHEEEKVFYEYQIFILTRIGSTGNHKQWIPLSTVSIPGTLATGKLWAGKENEKRDAKDEVMKSAYEAMLILKREHPQEEFRISITEHIY